MPTKGILSASLRPCLESVVIQQPVSGLTVSSSIGLRADHSGSIFPFYLKLCTAIPHPRLVVAANLDGEHHPLRCVSGRPRLSFATFARALRAKQTSEVIAHTQSTNRDANARRCTSRFSALLRGRVLKRSRARAGLSRRVPDAALAACGLGR